MRKSIKKGGVEIRPSENKSRHNQNDQCFKAMFALFSSYLKMRAINKFLGFDKKNKFNEQGECSDLSGDFQIESEDGSYYQERRADDIMICESIPTSFEFQTSYDEHMLERNCEYLISSILKESRTRTMKNGDDVEFQLPVACNLFLDGPKNVPEYSNIYFKDISGTRVGIRVRNLLFRNINVDEVIEEEIVPIMAVALYCFCDKSKKYGILEDEAKSEHLFSTFNKIFQKIKEMLENERLSIKDFEHFKRLFAITLENQLEHYKDAKERLLKMENTVFVIGLDKEIANKVEEYKQECARKKKELEAKLGHEISEDEFYLFEMVEEHKYEMARIEGRDEGKKEMIFNMFSDGLNDDIISKYSSGYSVEDIAALRKEWLKKVSSENAD